MFVSDSTFKNSVFNPITTTILPPSLPHTAARYLTALDPWSSAGKGCLQVHAVCVCVCVCECNHGCTIACSSTQNCCTPLFNFHFRTDVSHSCILDGCHIYSLLLCWDLFGLKGWLPCSLLYLALPLTAGAICSLNSKPEDSSGLRREIRSLVFVGSIPYQGFSKWIPVNEKETCKEVTIFSVKLAMKISGRCEQRYFYHNVSIA
jgi:hypothetical protein